MVYDVHLVLGENAIFNFKKLQCGNVNFGIKCKATPKLT